MCTYLAKWLMLPLLLWQVAGATWASEDLRSDTTLLQLGRALYTGQQSFVAPVRMGTVQLPTAAVQGGCAACHGIRGEGGREAGVVAPPVQWQRLQQARAGRSALVGEAAVLEAVTKGLGRDGVALHAPMPQFALTIAEQQALMAYLQVLGTEAQPQPGVYKERLVLGTVLPLTGPQAAIGARIQTTLMSRIAQVNSAGGMFGRRIELQVADAGASADSAASAAQKMMASQEVLALVASVVPQANAALVQAVAEYGVPMVATLGVPNVEASAAGVRYLLPSVDYQLTSLAQELERKCNPIAGAQTALVLQAAHASQLPLANLAPHWQLRQIKERRDVLTALSAVQPDRVIAMLPADWVDDARHMLATKRPQSCLGTLAIWSGSQPAAGAGLLTEVVVLPMQPVQQQIDVSSSDTLWTLLAQVGINTVLEALARSGRQLDGAKLLSAINSLVQYEAMPNMPVSFGLHKQHGLDVAYLWKERNHANTAQQSP
jgi:mono/diheme cytochrome c family protein